MCLYKRSLMYPLQWKMTPTVENESHPISGNNSVDPTSGKCESDSIS